MEQLVSHSEMYTLILSFTSLWIILSTYSAVFWKLTAKILFRMVGYLQKKCVGLHRWLCFMVNLVFAVLMMCGEHRRHCCSQSFCFSFVAVCYFSVLIIKMLSIYKLLLCILCMLCNLIFFLFLVIDLEYILILINSYRGTIPSVVRLYFSSECFGYSHGILLPMSENRDPCSAE